MTGGQPDPTRFTTAMCEAIEQVCRGRANYNVRIFGQIVDVLWREGRQVEVLWNRLAHTLAFSLLCGYAMGNFYKDSNFDDICGQHSHVVSADGRAQIVMSAAAKRQEGKTANLPSVA